MGKITQSNGWDLAEVDSSLIQVVAHNKENDLFIKFKTGREYIYHEVPRDEFEALISADSVGKYFLEEIKDDYDFTNLGDENDTEQFCDEDDTESEDEE